MYVCTVKYKVVYSQQINFQPNAATAGTESVQYTSTPHWTAAADTRLSYLLESYFFRLDNAQAHSSTIEIN